jgi:hypothetical protein
MDRMTACVTFDFGAISLWVQGGYGATVDAASRQLSTNSWSLFEGRAMGS